MFIFFYIISSLNLFLELFFPKILLSSHMKLHMYNVTFKCPFHMWICCRYSSYYNIPTNILELISLLGLRVYKVWDSGVAGNDCGLLYASLIYLLDWCKIRFFKMNEKGRRATTMQNDMTTFSFALHSTFLRNIFSVLSPL